MQVRNTKLTAYTREACKHSNDLLNSYPVANYDMALMIVTTDLIGQQIMGN